MTEWMGEASTATRAFSMDPRGFVRAVMKHGCEMELADARENVEAIFKIDGGRRTRVLVDLRGVRSQSREARLYFAEPEAERATAAVALLTGSPVSRVLANFFFKVIPQRIPTAVHTDEEAAINWLLERSG